MEAKDILRTADKLVSGDRAKTHGPKMRNHNNITRLWRAYLLIRKDRDSPLSPQDVAIMMALLKIARTQLGEPNIDNFIDGAAYLGIAGELESEPLP